MQLNPTENTTSQPATLRFRMSMGARLWLWLDGWWERRLHIRGAAQAAELNGHLLQDIGLEDVRPERWHLTERREAGARAFNLRFLRTP